MLSATATIVALSGGLLTVTGVFFDQKNESQKDQKIIELTTELYNYARGGDSFCFLHFAWLNTGSRRAHIIHKGKHPVRNLIFEIDTNKNGGDLIKWTNNIEKSEDKRIDVITPNSNRSLKKFPFPDENENRALYKVFITSESSSLIQYVTLTRVNGEWFQKYYLSRVDGETQKENKFCEYFDPVLKGEMDAKSNVPNCLKLSGLGQI